jgi:hypothetical protein
MRFWMLSKRKESRIVVTAVARELVGFAWAAMHEDPAMWTTRAPECCEEGSPTDHGSAGAFRRVESPPGLLRVALPIHGPLCSGLPQGEGPSWIAANLIAHPPRAALQRPSAG